MGRSWGWRSGAVNAYHKTAWAGERRGSSIEGSSRGVACQLWADSSMGGLQGPRPTASMLPPKQRQPGDSTALPPRRGAPHRAAPGYEYFSLSL